MGVDGIITDYPDRLRAVMAQHRLPLPEPTPVGPGDRLDGR
jgi:glycerophosphoryl diester phosphodiesterase